MSSWGLCPTSVSQKDGERHEADPLDHALLIDGYGSSSVGGSTVALKRTKVISIPLLVLRMLLILIKASLSFDVWLREDLGEHRLGETGEAEKLRCRIA